jgi:hypothetical protein
MVIYAVCSGRLRALQFGRRSLRSYAWQICYGCEHTGSNELISGSSN